MKTWVIILLVLGALYLFTRKSSSSSSAISSSAASNTLPVTDPSYGQNLANKIISDVQQDIPDAQNLANQITSDVQNQVSNLNTTNSGGSVSIVCQNGVCHKYIGSHNTTCINGVCHSDMALEGISRS